MLQYLFDNCDMYTGLSTVGDDCVTGSVRLGDAIDVVGEGVREGRVEVCVNQAWGTVCDDLFTQNNTDVVCQQLPGFKKEGTYITKPESHMVPPFLLFVINYMYIILCELGGIKHKYKTSIY